MFLRTVIDNPLFIVGCATVALAWRKEAAYVVGGVFIILAIFGI